MMVENTDAYMMAQLVTARTKSGPSNNLANSPEKEKSDTNTSGFYTQQPSVGEQKFKVVAKQIHSTQSPPVGMRDSYNM